MNLSGNGVTPPRIRKDGGKNEGFPKGVRWATTLGLTRVNERGFGAKRSVFFGS